MIRFCRKFCLNLATTLVFALITFGLIFLINKLIRDHKSLDKSLDRLVAAEDDRPVYFSRQSARRRPTSPFFDDTGKYLTIRMPWCGGLCNMLYRFASIYGIARSVNRVPYVEGHMNCVRKSVPAYAAAMPNLYAHIFFKKPKRTTKIDFADDWCRYVNPKKLQQYSNATNLRISGGWLQSFKFFNAYKSEIRRLFDFGPGVRILVSDYATALFGNDSSHKLCVHTRVGDFRNHFLLESSFNFTNPALEFVVMKLKAQFSNISVVLISADAGFNAQIIHRRYIVDGLSAFEDLHFGSTYCDSLLLTASGSTFGWWIGYLMAEHKQRRVFYNVETSKSRGFCKNSLDYDTFLPDWQRVRQLANGTLSFEPRWHVDIEKAEKNPKKPKNLPKN